MITKIARFATLTLLGLSLSLTNIAPAVADSVDGPTDGHSDSVRARTTDVYHVSFYGGEEAMIGATGEGDIDILVYDASGKLVAKDVASDDTPVCVWTPKRTQKYTIKVVNNENYRVGYVLLSN